MGGQQRDGLRPRLRVFIGPVGGSPVSRHRAVKTYSRVVNARVFPMPAVATQDSQLASSSPSQSASDAAANGDPTGTVSRVAPHFWRDLSRDWRRWTAAERTAALGLFVTIALMLLIGLLHRSA